MKKRTPLVIIESPYAGNVQLNELYLSACLADSLAHGEAPFASHGLYTRQGVLDDTVPEERNKGIAAGFAWGRVADRVAVYRDLGVSKGMQDGVEIARSRGIPIEYRILRERWEDGEWPEDSPIGKILDYLERQARSDNYLRLLGQRYGFLPKEEVENEAD